MATEKTQKARPHRFTCYFPEEEWRALAHESVDRDMTVSAIMLEAYRSRIQVHFTERKAGEAVPSRPK